MSARISGDIGEKGIEFRKQTLKSFKVRFLISISSLLTS